MCCILTKVLENDDEQHNSPNTTRQISDCRLCMEMPAIREIKERGEIDLQWMNKERQITDCHTKKGATCFSMLTTLKNGKLH